MTEPAPRKSDLGVRVASAVVMVAVVGAALWFGGTVWNVFVLVIAAGVLWEWRGLAIRFDLEPIGKLLWTIGGLLYVGTATATMLLIRSYNDAVDYGPPPGFERALTLLGSVICVDVGAYFCGRTLGGPKIAPKISPSKTWAGLFGGIIGASIFLVAEESVPSGHLTSGVIQMLVLGTLVAVIAQGGDFFESWMKRRAGAKDSGALIPGHGGLFDRVDGLMAVAFVYGLFWLPTI